jgi:hypothetical protein
MTEKDNEELYEDSRTHFPTSLLLYKPGVLSMGTLAALGDVIPVLYCT